MLATKFHGRMGDGPNRRGNSRRWIMREVEESLRRLQTDYIDLYQVHRPEPGTDIDETLGALTDLVRAGKVRYIGVSTFPAHEIVEAQWAAEKRGRERFVTEQPPYSLLARGIEARRAAGLPALRDGRARRGARSRAAGSPAATARAQSRRSRTRSERVWRPLRHVAAGERAQARRGRGARAARRGGGPAR